VHELLRQFAAEQLARDPQREAQVCERHAAYYVALVEHATANRSTNELWGMVDREHHNLISALSWMRDHEQIEHCIQLATRLVRFWRARGYLVEGLRILEDLVARATTQPASLQAQAQAYYAAAFLADARGNQTRAQEWLMESLGRYRTLDDDLGVIRVLKQLGGVAFNRGDLAGAIGHWQAMLQQTQEHPDSVAIASERVHALGNVGEAYYHLGVLDKAQQHYEAALVLARELKQIDLEAMQLGDLGMLARQRGAYSQAKVLHGQALRIWQHIGEYRRIAITIERLAVTLVAHGRLEGGARLLGAATRLRKELGVRAAQPEQREHEHIVQLARERMGETAWAQAFEAGAALSTEAIVDEALAMTDPSKEGSEAWILSRDFPRPS
jgi:tetratricopeptide (TPR) repeat protein